MTSPRGLVDPSLTNVTRGPFSDTAEADDRVFLMVQHRAVWSPAERGEPAGSAQASTMDPQDWLFAQRARYQSHGSCNPWAEQMLYRAGMLPVAPPAR